MITKREETALKRALLEDTDADSFSELMELVEAVRGSSFILRRSLQKLETLMETRDISLRYGRCENVYDFSHVMKCEDIEDFVQSVDTIEDVFHDLIENNE